MIEFSVGGSTQFYLQGNGRMGIATAAPQDLMEIYSSNSGALSALRITNEGDAANSAAGVSFYSDDSANGDFEMARVESLLVDNTNGSEDAKLSFKTMKAGSLSSVMMLMETGSVGIGTDTPDEDLVVNNAAEAEVRVDGGTNSILSLDANGDSDDSSMQFQKDGTTVGSILYNHHSSGTSEQMEFSVNGTQRMYINGGGNVGVGTSAPQNRIDVEGSMVVGASYSGSTAAPAHGLLVEGDMGIGTTSPQSKVDVEGNMAIGASYSGSTAAPTNGLIVEGNVGIGESSPDQDLEVSNAAEAEIHIDGGTNAVLSLDANADANSSTLQFQKAGSTEGSIVYNHDSSDGSELMEFTVGGSTTVYFEGSGEVGIGTNTPANELDIEGSMAIGTSYSGSTAAPSNGLIVEGDSGFGTNSPEMRLQVTGGGLCVGSNAQCNSDNDTEGTIYANNSTLQGADYAEYFEKEDDATAGDLVGLNPATGKVRVYQTGDQLLGVVSTNPGVVGNGWADKSTNILVGLMGQLEFNKEQVVIEDNIVKTLDGKTLGFLLANGKVYINLGSNLDGDSKKRDERVEALEQQHKQQQLLIDELKQQIQFLMNTMK